MPKITPSDSSTEFISIPEAIKIAKEKGVILTAPTVVANVKKHRLGHQLGGTVASPKGSKGARWLVSRIRWEDFINGRW